MDHYADTAEAVCRYGSSRLAFRGPQTVPEGPYIVALGGSETFGRFVEAPFPAFLGRLTGLPCVNLGCMFAGPGAFQDDKCVLDICEGAEAVVVQVMGAQNLSNRLYSVHPRRNDRFVRLGRAAPDIIPEIDLSDVHFTGHLLRRIVEAVPDRVDAIVDELSAAWLARMRTLLSRIAPPTVLLDLPNDAADATLGPLPTRDMVAEIAAEAAGVVEIAASDAARAEDTAAAGLTAEPVAAASLPGPRHHREIAERLAEVVVPILRSRGHDFDDDGWGAGRGQTFSVSSGTASKRSATSA